MDNASKVNVKDLRVDLVQMYQDLKDGKIGHKEGRVINSVAQTIIKSAMEQRKYNEMIQSKNIIKFLNSDE
jgi:hypothetical protein